MRKIYLSVIGFSIICRLSGYAQTRQDSINNKPVISISKPVEDSSAYKARRLRIDEINLVSSYYSQTGDHSAITGGIGTQNVTDVSNGLDIKFAWSGPNNNKNTLTTGFGIDHHTSASSAFVTTTPK